MINKKQIVVIQGGNVFNSHDEYIEELKSKTLTMDKIRNNNWKKTLNHDLGEDYDVLSPSMPCRDNAKYKEWKIWFEKIIPLLDPEVIFIGSSLGGIFLAKYLSENDYPGKILATLLVAAPYKLETKYALGDFVISGELTKLEKQGGKIFLYQSKDDPIVMESEVEEYRKRLPKATVSVLDGYGHFNVPEFPEIIEDIKTIW